MTWRVEVLSGTAAELHAAPFPAEAALTVYQMQPTAPALVLGSGQRDRNLDDVAGSAGMAVARRRSGGGAVLIEPDHSAWFDMLIPAGGPHYSPDLGHTFLTVGGWWQQTLAALGIESELWQERPGRSSLSDAVCFAGRGWGEVMVGGQKVVGLSQRRTRWGARIQCLAVRRTQTRRVAEFLGVSGADELAPDAPISALDAVWPAVGPTFLGHLPTEIADMAPPGPTKPQNSLK